MKKKQLTQYELEMKHTRSIFGLFALSVFLDALILFLGFWDMTEGLFWGMYALYTIVLSPIITMGVTYLACLITRKDYETREKLVFFRIGRLVVLAIMNFNGLVINPNWSTSEGERSFFIAFVFMVVLGVIGAIVQLVIGGKIEENVMVPKKPRGSYKKSSLNSIGNVEPSDRVKETEWYKNKAEEYYNTYMGYPPKEKDKSDDGVLDDHDYSDIFKDKNW